MTTKITGNEVQKMIRHWLETPVNGYLGSSYGQDAKALLQRPHSDGAADNFLEKLRSDVPVLQVMPNGSVNLYATPKDFDKLEITLEVGGTGITIGKSS